MRSIKMDFVRDGGDTAVLEKGRTYHVVIESSQHRQFKMPLNHDESFDRLAELRYHDAIGERKRKAALRKLSKTVTKIVSRPEAPPEALQLDLLTDAHELWALPFEAALAPDGEPLFARRESVVVLTRRTPQQFAERQPNWQSRPRILFAYASPEWVDGPTVDFSAHTAALLEGIPAIGETATWPTHGYRARNSCSPFSRTPAWQTWAGACRREADAKGRPYTHVHLLAHGLKLEKPGYGAWVRAAAGRGSPVDNNSNNERSCRRCGRPDRKGQEMPLVVTLAVCDSGNAGDAIIEAGG